MIFFGLKSYKSGFTLIEIMFVVAILLVMVNLTIPNIQRSRMNANEQAAISGLRTLSTAMDTYLDTFNAYPPNLTALTNNPAFIPNALVTNCSAVGGLVDQYHGYQYCYTRIANTEYNCSAIPRTANVTGTRSFRVTKSGVIEQLQGAAWTPME